MIEALKPVFFVVFAVGPLAAQTTLPPDAASALFDSPVLEDIKLTVAPADWLQLKKHYLENTYYPAAFSWRGQTVAHIGIRSRGNGSRSPIKPSLKLDFGKYESATFLGLKSLVLKNMTQDPPMLREYLSMALFRQMGLPAPRENYVRLFVNDEYQGLYIAIEPLDKVFLKRNYKIDTGDLFSLEWGFPYHFEYLGPDPEAYCPLPFKPETNDKNPNVAPLIELAELLETTPDEELISAVERRVDLDNLLGHIAVDAYIAQTDGFLGELGMNNVYLHRPLKTTASPEPQISLIAWDKDACFAWYEAPPLHNAEENRLIGRLLSRPPLVERYYQQLESVALAAGGEDGWLAQTLNAAVDRIREAALSDPNKPYSNSTFEQSVEDTRFFIAERSIQLARHFEAFHARTANSRPLR